MRARLAPTLAALAALAGCAAPLTPRAPVAEAPRPLWELAPEGASLGVVIHDGALARAFDLFDTMHLQPASGDPATEATLLPPSTAAAVQKLGVDPSLGLAVFAWPEKERGLLVVVPVRDRAGLRALTTARPVQSGGREIDELGNGYRCLAAAGRYLCARTVAEIDAAVAPHEAGLPRVVARLPAEDRGEVEIFGSPRRAEIAHLRERARPLGLLTGVAAALRFRADGAGLRVHLLGSTDTPLSRGLAGAGAPSGLTPIAAGAPTVVRAHFDAATLLPASLTVDPRLRAELIEQLAGDVEVTTSGAGFAGGALVAPLRDPARVERYVKERCADAGGRVRRYALDKITVTAHGCGARFDAALLLLPVAIPPVPITVTVEDRRLVVLLGEGKEPAAEQRAWDALVEGDEARRALGGAAALQVFTRRPVLGPDVGAARAFREMSPFVDARAAQLIDTWSDIGAHIYQAIFTARVTEDGIVAVADVTTFFADPPAARRAYEDALGLRARGDEPGYRAALAAIEQRFPGTRAARRAAEVKKSAPFLGAGALFFAVLGGLLSQK